MTTVDPAQDHENLDYIPCNEQDKFVHELYDAERFLGCPINLQIVGRRQEEEKVLAALEEIERAMGRS